MNRRKGILPLLSSGLFRGLGAVSQFLLAWWVSRMLFKDASGAFFLYLACHTVLSPILLMGTQFFGMRQISQFDEDDTASIRSHAWQAARLSTQAVSAASIVLLVAAVVSERFFAGTVWFDPWAGLLVPLAFGSAIHAVSLATASHLHGLKHFGQSLFYSHIAAPLLSIFVMMAVRPTSSIEVVYCHLLACSLAASGAVATWLWHFRLPAHDEIHLSRRAAWAASRDLWLINCCILIVNWFPVIIGGALVASGQVAELNIAQRAASLINFVLVIISFAFAPRLRRAWAKSDRIALKQDVARCASLLLSIGTLAFFVVFFAAEHVLRLFGPEYASGATVLRIFAAGQYFNVLTGSVNQILMMWGHERTLRTICFASATACLVLASCLGILYGAVGIALGAAIALCLQNVSAVWAVRKHFGFWVFDPRSRLAGNLAS